ncbi:MAG: copper homeostasis protein CutC [Angelakisella sp.]
MKNYTLECCVDSFESANAAMEGGASRLELCSCLQVGGITPGINLFREINSFCTLPVNILLRPRFGDFCYTRHEYRIMMRDACMFQDVGVNGMVIGVLTPEGKLNMPFMKDLIEAADGCAITLHRAFDMCVDPFETLEQAIELGCSSILTSGQCGTAMEGAELIAKLHKAAAGRIEIMAGCGVNSQNIKALVAATNTSAYHLTAKAKLPSSMTFRRGGLSMGLPSMSEYELWRTDSREVGTVDRILRNSPEPQ